ncbi:hypothetical protein FISHEDRAFT_60442 [Fistulina hepatica ATCC 64428]|uniref:Uncharacterized protein n=1 Tax=Fistulina hepatica ATCC 64428 TaxID=1128425 RepID=A0A0D7A7I1_9AGAR|nr:hypothetical protein FISHEDRAFT_60442 [Fistulina hepatica ATCC 64428]
MVDATHCCVSEFSSQQLEDPMRRNASLAEYCAPSKPVDGIAPHNLSRTGQPLNMLSVHSLEQFSFNDCNSPNWAPSAISIPSIPDALSPATWSPSTTISSLPSPVVTTPVFSHRPIVRATFTTNTPESYYYSCAPAASCDPSHALPCPSPHHVEIDAAGAECGWISMDQSTVACGDAVAASSAAYTMDYDSGDADTAVNCYYGAVFDGSRDATTMLDMCCVGQYMEEDGTYNCAMMDDDSCYGQRFYGDPSESVLPANLAFYGFDRADTCSSSGYDCTYSQDTNCAPVPSDALGSYTPAEQFLAETMVAPSSQQVPVVQPRPVRTRDTAAFQRLLQYEPEEAPDDVRVQFLSPAPPSQIPNGPQTIPAFEASTNIFETSWDDNCPLTFTFDDYAGVIAEETLQRQHIDTNRDMDCFTQWT